LHIIFSLILSIPRGGYIYAFQNYAFRCTTESVYHPSTKNFGSCYSYRLTGGHQKRFLNICKRVHEFELMKFNQSTETTFKHQIIIAPSNSKYLFLPYCKYSKKDDDTEGFTCLSLSEIFM
jgi:hypothetical protein